MSEQQSYTPEEVNKIIDEVSNQYEKQMHQSSIGQSKNYSTSPTLGAYQNSIVEWQLDLSKEFDLIYHQLRGHVIKRDKDGNEYWSEPTIYKLIAIIQDKSNVRYYYDLEINTILKIKNPNGEEYDLDYTTGKKLAKTLDYNNMFLVEKKSLEVIDYEQKLLNEKGAQEVEKIIRNYLNKNILLSNYTQDQIYLRLSQFAHRIRRFIYLNYDEFGLDTYYKQKHFEMIVMNIVDTVDAAYHRALNGGERESLTTIRQIVQQETFDSSNQQNTPQYQPSGSKLNPMNWFR